MKPECRTLDEVATLYKLEATIQDVYVEGDWDRSLIEWYLAERGLQSVGVNTIEYVEVPAGAVLGGGFDDNNRGRLLTLANFLQEQLGGDFRRVICIADSDFDLIDRRTHHCRLLVLTDYTSIELYCFNPKTLGKFLKIGIGNFPKPGDLVINEISETLQVLFTVRLANRNLGWGMQAVSFEKNFSVDGSGLRLDLKGYLGRYLHKNKRNAQSVIFIEAIAQCKGQLTPEPRFQIHGHDFMDALTWYLKHHNGFGHLRKDIVERALLASLEVGLLKEELLFRTLAGRL
jgi:hypothetical protein